MIDLLPAAFQHLSQSGITMESFSPYPFQQAAAEALLSGRRVVLRAPIGSGKGLAAVFPWIASRLHAYDYPPKLLHVLPGGALFHNTQLRLECLARTLPDTRVSVQTECDALDPFLLADAVVTSADQLLSIALHRPHGLHPSLGNINAGVLLGAYPVFEEFPALQSSEALYTWLGLLRRYYPVTRCLWTTGLWPRALAQQIATVLDAEYIEGTDVDSGGQRTWSASAAISPDRILRQHQGRTIVMCNTVRGAQTLYRALRQVIEQQEVRTELLLLHQYQFAHDRLPIERHAASLFTPQSDANVLLVTTSCIAAGTELSAELMITDPASPDQLLQRAGHCARFEGELGRMLVAHTSESASTAPTATSLLQHLCDDRPHTFSEELTALDLLWEEMPEDELPEVLRHLPTAEACEVSATKALAGDISDHLFPRVGVTLHRTPEMVQDPFELERFSLPYTSLERSWHRWQSLGCPGEWFALIPHWHAVDQHAPSWSLLSDTEEIRSETQLIVINADAVSYDPVIGFEMAEGTAYQSGRLPAQHTTWNPLDQHVESYQEHATRALAAFDQQASWYRYTLRHLGMHWHIPLVELEQWIRLCILWHDAGKLTADWQRAAFRWQTEVMRRQAPSDVVARIDYQQRRDGPFPCPAHAEATELVLFRALAIVLGGRSAIHRGSLLALRHHHGVIHASEVDLTPHPEAWATLMRLAESIVDPHIIHRIDRTGWTMQPIRLFQEIDAQPDDPDIWMSYCLLARAIRLADREVALARPFS